MNPTKPKPTRTDAVANELTGQADPTLSGPNYATDEELVRIPVIEEQLQVGTQTIETGRIRLVKTVHEQEQTVDVAVIQAEFQIERVPMDQVVDHAPPTRQEGDTTIYAVIKEEIVVHKRLRLIEEIRVTPRQVATNETRTVALRREEVTIDRLPTNAPSEGPNLSGLDGPNPSRPGGSTL